MTEAKTICFMPRRPGTRRAAFRQYYEARHAPLAVPLFPFRRYRRNHLADMAVEPGFDCISEFWLSSLERVGELMSGEVGETMRADERNFLDQASVVAALATEALPSGVETKAVVLLTRAGGDDVSLVAACRAAGAGLDLIAPFDERRLPRDAIAYATAAEFVAPKGWTAGPRLAVERCETDPATLLG